MRKTVQIMGVGQRKSGISKRNGKPYDFMEISIGYESPGFSGLRCEVVAVDAFVIGERVLAPGDVVDIILHQYNFRTIVDAIL